MWKLIKAEFFQTVRRKEFYVMFLMLGVVYFFFYINLLNVKPASEVFAWVENERGIHIRSLIEIMSAYSNFNLDDFHSLDEIANYYLKYAFGDEVFREFPPVLLTPLFLAPMLLSTDFSKRTINLSVYSGYSRHRLFFAKTLYYYIVLISVSVFWIMMFGLYNFGIKGLQIIGVGNILRWLLIAGYLMVGIYSIPLFLCYLTKNLLGTVIANLGIVLIVIFGYVSGPIAPVPVWKQMIHPAYLMNTPNLLFGQNFALSLEQWAVFLLAPLLMTIVMISLAYVMFVNAELK